LPTSWPAHLKEARHRQTAQIREAEAAAAESAADRARLEREAREAAAVADTLAQQKAQLEEADRVRLLWYAHTAATRAAADRARDELRNRGIDPDQTGDETTAEEWLAAHAEADRAEDLTRVVRDEEDLADVAAARKRDQAEAFDRLDGPAVVVEPAEPAPQPPPERDTDDWNRVPTVEETAAAVALAKRALTELNRRREREEQHTRDEQRQAELARWHAEQEAAQIDQRAPHRIDEQAPVLEPAGG
jgi:hypothetical protein